MYLIKERREIEWQDICNQQALAHPLQQIEGVSLGKIFLAVLDKQSMLLDTRFSN